MSPEDFRDAFSVYVEHGPCAAYEFVTDEQGYTKTFARRAVDSFEYFVIAEVKA